MNLDAQIRGLRLVYFAIAAGAIVFAGVVFVIMQEGLLGDVASDLGIVAWVGAGFPLVILPTAFAMRGALCGKAAAEDAIERRFELFRSSVIVFAALLESAILFNLVAWLVVGEAALNGGVAIAVWAVLLANAPTADQFESLTK